MIIRACDTRYTGVVVWKNGCPIGCCQEVDTDTKRYRRIIYPFAAGFVPKEDGSNLPMEEGTYDHLVASEIMEEKELEELRAAGVEIMSNKYARNEWPWAFPPEWAWEDVVREYYTAGFKTREEAIEHVQWTANYEKWERSRKINIGHAVWPEPGMYASMDAGDFVADVVDENAYGDGCYTDDEPLFDFNDQKKAQEELITFLRRWANRHLKPCKWTFKKVEEIMIGACEDGAGSPCERKE